jgi:hypothetical protein
MMEFHYMLSNFAEDEISRDEALAKLAIGEYVQVCNEDGIYGRYHGQVPIDTFEVEDYDDVGGILVLNPKEYYYVIDGDVELGFEESAEEALAKAESILVQRHKDDEDYARQDLLAEARRERIDKLGTDIE